MSYEEEERLLGFPLKESQRNYLDKLGERPTRTCLYFKTGEGKSIAALTGLRQQGYKDALVIAPPITFAAWDKVGMKLGMRLTFMSHEKFRMKGTQVFRGVPIIADEFHQFGRHTGQGWRKLEALARGFKESLVLCSATPNYNDAERCYCIERILDRPATNGGYLNWLYKHCQTEQSPFSRTPDFVGFHRHKDAVEYLASLDNVFYVADDADYEIVDFPVTLPVPWEFEVFGYDRRAHEIVASDIGRRHRRKDLQLLVEVDGEEEIHPEVYEAAAELVGMATTPVLIFSANRRFAEAFLRECRRNNVRAGLITGEVPTRLKDSLLRQFLAGELDVLIGTASLATGTDGIDKMCDMLIILDDTDDASKRRQLVGRILPRGVGTAAHSKQIYRIVPS